MSSNLDRKGNVLWLDEERLARKDNGYTPYRNPSNGLGIVNFIKEHCSARPWNMKLMTFVFHFAVEGSKLLKKGGLLSRIYRRIAMISPDQEKHTAAVVLPLNVDLTKCTGCGLCMSGPYGCPQDAITIKQTMPVREDLHEYFEKEFNIDVKAWDNRP